MVIPVHPTEPAPLTTLDTPAAPNVTLRWVTFVVVAAAIAYSSLADLSASGSDIVAVSRRYDNAFTPAPFAFAIWGVIYGAFLAYCVVGLLPSRRHMAIYDRVAGSLMLANVLGAAWVAAFRHDMIIVSLVVAAAMLVLAWRMFDRTSRWVESGRARFWLSVPFASFFAWMCVATLANLSVARVWLGWTVGSFDEVAWAVGMLALATAVGIGVGGARQQFVLPAVIAWAATAIGIAAAPTQPAVAAAAALASLICGVAAAAFAVRRLRIRGSSPPATSMGVAVAG